MNRFAYIFILLILIACDSHKNDWVKITEYIHLNRDEKIRVADSHGNSLFVSVTSIEESRCPEDAVCIQEGNVLVFAEIEDSRNSQFRALLCLGDCSPARTDKRSFILYGREYYIQLLEVRPFPTTKNQDDEKMTVLKLFEL